MVEQKEKWEEKRLRREERYQRTLEEKVRHPTILELREADHRSAAHPTRDQSRHSSSH